MPGLPKLAGTRPGNGAPFRLERRCQSPLMAMLGSASTDFWCIGAATNVVLVLTAHPLTVIQWSGVGVTASLPSPLGATAPSRGRSTHPSSGDWDCVGLGVRHSDSFSVGVAQSLISKRGLSGEIALDSSRFAWAKDEWCSAGVRSPVSHDIEKLEWLEWNPGELRVASCSEPMPTARTGGCGSR